MLSWDRFEGFNSDVKDVFFRRHAWHRLVNPAEMNYFVIKECIKYVFKCSDDFFGKETMIKLQLFVS